jgi:aspartate/tyrosine/aromatic aminotransferase
VKIRSKNNGQIKNIFFKDGRISMAGIASSNVDYLANAIHEVTK